MPCLNKAAPTFDKLHKGTNTANSSVGLEFQSISGTIVQHNNMLQDCMTTSCSHFTVGSKGCCLVLSDSTQAQTCVGQYTGTNKHCH